MHQAGTPNYILSTLEYKLSLTLHIKYVQTFFLHGQIPPNNYPLLLPAIRHQNIIRWDNFLQGYTFVYWVSLFNLAHSDNSKQQSTRWDVKLVTSGIQILKEIWSDRNSQFHGTIKAETRILHRERILNQVHHIYAHPPRLHKRFPRVTAIPLATRVSGSTTNLERWLSHLEHQKTISRLLFHNDSIGQLTLKQAFGRVGMDLIDQGKLPP